MLRGMHKKLVFLALAAMAGCSVNAAEPAQAQGQPSPTPSPAAASQDAATPASSASASADAVAATGCDAARLPLASDGVVARVDGQPIRASDLGEDAIEAQEDALRAYCSEIHRIRQAAVDRAVDEAVLSKAATAKGTDVDGFVQQHLQTAVAQPTDAEVTAYYDQNKRADAPPLDTVRDQVAMAMSRERSQEAMAQLVTDLRGKAEVEVLLPDVRPPAVEVSVPEHAPTFGPADAKVQVVEFSDFECPYCGRAADVVSEIKDKYGDEVQFAFRHFPLSFHANAKPAAELAQCAHEQGKFWAVHDKIFDDQKALGSEQLRSAAESAGLDMGELDTCLASGRPDQAVEADLADAMKLGVKGTPTFYINGRAYEGNISVEALSQAIDAELAGAS